MVGAASRTWPYPAPAVMIARRRLLADRRYRQARHAHRRGQVIGQVDIELRRLKAQIPHGGRGRNTLGSPVAET